MSEPVTTELPLVSICIPAFNASDTLSDTLDSVLAQDYPNCEIIVSDNHSTDSTRSIILSYADRGVRYCSPPARPDWAANMPSYIGAYINANFVSSQARAELICLYHADDLYQPDIIRKQVALMQSSDSVGAIFTMLRTIGEDGHPISLGSTQLPPEMRGRQFFDFEELFNAVLSHANFLSAPSVMLRKSVLEAVGAFNEQQFRTSADLEMWLRIARKYRIGVIDEPLLNYRVSHKQFSAQYNKLRTTASDIFAVLDYLLAKPEMRRMARLDAISKYEIRRISDDLFRATSMVIRGDLPNARALLELTCSRPAFKAGLRSSRYARRFLLGKLLLLSFRLGLGGLCGKAYAKIYLPWRNRRAMEPIRQPRTL